MCIFVTWQHVMDIICYAPTNICNYCPAITGANRKSSKIDEAEKYYWAFSALTPKSDKNSPSGSLNSTRLYTALYIGFALVDPKYDSGLIGPAVRHAKHAHDLGCGMGQMQAVYGKAWRHLVTNTGVDNSHAIQQSVRGNSAAYKHCGFQQHHQTDMAEYLQALLRKEDNPETYFASCVFFWYGNLQDAESTTAVWKSLTTLIIKYGATVITMCVPPYGLHSNADVHVRVVKNTEQTPGTSPHLWPTCELYTGDVSNKSKQPSKTNTAHPRPVRDLDAARMSADAPVGDI